MATYLHIQIEVFYLNGHFGKGDSIVRDQNNCLDVLRNTHATWYAGIIPWGF